LIRPEKNLSITKLFT